MPKYLSTNPWFPLRNGGYFLVFAKAIGMAVYCVSRTRLLSQCLGMWMSSTTPRLRRCLSRRLCFVDTLPDSLVQRRQRFCPHEPQEVVHAWQEGIDRLLERGVTGRILLANFVTTDFAAVSLSRLEACSKPCYGNVRRSELCLRRGR